MGSGARTSGGLILAVLLASSLFSTNNALGDTITYQALIAPMPTDWDQFVTVPKFDPGTGTLDFVVVRLSASYQAQILAENRAANPANLTAWLDQTVILTPPSSLAALSTIASIPPSTQPVAPYDGIPFTGPDTAIWSLGPAQLSAQQTFTGADLSPFIGAGAVSLHAVGTAQFLVTSDGGAFATQLTSQSGAQVDVEYHFTIPEPATIALLVFGVGAISRRRSS